MKKDRQEKILEIINTNEVFTQEELTRLLKAEGINATQATVSRDMRALNLIKIAGKGGRQKYAPTNGTAIDRIMAARIFKEGVTSVDYAGNIVIVKTYAGMANAVCTGIDSLNNANILGTVAGDDTIMCVVRNSETALMLIDELKTGKD